MNPAPPPLTALLLAAIRDCGPITVADFMELALYHPEHGYYASASRRSGRHGDFFTSVDVGPLFGQLLAVQIVEMWSVLRAQGAAGFHLVEAGAGDGRLARDILDAIATASPDLYDVSRLTLVERSTRARARHADVLGTHFNNIPIESTASLPRGITGAIVANELLDALPVHVVVMTTTGLCEVHVDEEHGVFKEVLRPLTNERILTLLENTGGVTGEEGRQEGSGIRVEAGIAAMDWIAEAASAIDRGFLLIVDYGREAAELYSSHHPSGTLTAYRAHTAGASDWLEAPGSCDLTAHVNVTALRHAAREAGLEPLGLVDQTYFLTSLGLAGLLSSAQDLGSIRLRLAARTLIQPGGLGSTLKAMAFGKGVGTPDLMGFKTGRAT